MLKKLVTLFRLLFTQFNGRNSNIINILSTINISRENHTDPILALAFTILSMRNSTAMLILTLFVIRKSIIACQGRQKAEGSCLEIDCLHYFWLVPARQLAQRLCDFLWCMTLACITQLSLEVQGTFLKNGTKSPPKITSENLKN